MKNQTIINGGIVTALLAFAIYYMVSKPKTGYVVIQEVYTNFEFKKELERKFTITKNARQKGIDSLELELKYLVNKLEQQKTKDKNDILIFNNKRDEYLHKKKISEEDNAALSNQYDTEILTQLNQYVKDYGTENNYTYIYGNDGNGSLMYSKESENLTKKVTEYINKKYNGK
ncbi:MAG: OmpH family outer membrane protein [Bacteroidia bacterium]|nr:OmpH family outer membrane protein [Bacteroidia bacterium]